eukprot:scaffold23928_cov54-Attheya_sp.AAC.5
MRKTGGNGNPFASRAQLSFGLFLATPTGAAATMMASVVVGYGAYIWVGRGQETHSHHSAVVKGNPPSMSPDQALIHAMVHNARESTWQENISNAVDAHERFVLPFSKAQQQEPAFVSKIVKRSDALLHDQQQQRNNLNIFDDMPQQQPHEQQNP